MRKLIRQKAAKMKYRPLGRYRFARFLAKKSKGWWMPGDDRWGWKSCLSIYHTNGLGVRNEPKRYVSSWGEW